MNKLKIAYYTEINLGDNDGPSVNEIEFINSLSALNINQYKIILPNVNKNLDLLKDKQVIFLPPAPRISNLIGWLKRFQQVNKILKEHQVDLIVCRLTDFPFIPFFIKLFNKHTKLAIKTAALWWEGKSIDLSPSLLDKIYDILNNTLTKLVYKLSDAVDVAMPETKSKLLELKLISEKHTCLIDNAINTNLFQPKDSSYVRKRLNIPNDAVVLGFAGSLPSHRGAKQILQVAHDLQDYNIYVLIVGYDKELPHIIEASHFSKQKIIAVGKVPYEDVNDYISAMTICYSFFEPWKISKTGNASQKVKQYISMGKPVISVAVGHQYLKDNNVGSPVDQENNQQIVNETRKWIEIIRSEGENLELRLHNFAKEYLSTNRTFKQRLDFWNSIITG